MITLSDPAQVLETLQIEGPVLTVDEDVVKVELPQNVDHPWRGKGKAVATRLAAGAHGGLDPVRLLHRTSSWCAGRAGRMAHWARRVMPWLASCG
jgi:hypothetical protein